MNHIPKEKIEQIKEKVNIVEIISSYVNLQKKGVNYLGLCPFHDDTKASLTVSEPKQIFKCFVCGAGGDVYSFLINIENISYIQSIFFFS